MKYNLYFPSVAFSFGLAFLPLHLYAQERDLRAERVILDDNAGDGTANTMTIRTAQPLFGDVILTIPDPGTATAEFMLAPAGGGGGMWLLGGNAGTTSGTNFIGTTDTNALHLYVDGGSGNSLILNTNGSLQRGPAGNARGSDAVDLQHFRSNATEVAAGDFSVVVGGRQNTAAGILAMVGAGRNNSASGNFAFIGGGTDNVASDQYGTIGGGRGNVASGELSAIGGGVFNEATGRYSTIAGGFSNDATSEKATIGGGFQNRASGERATVGGGEWNLASHTFATVAGGYLDTASGSYSAVGGGQYNVASGTRSTVGGGGFNTASANDAVVAGGIGNHADGAYSAIAGGYGLTFTSGASGSFGFLGGNAGGNSMTIAAPDVAVFGNTDLWLANNNNNASRLRFYEASNTNGAFPSGTNHTSFRAGAQSGDIHYVLPTTLPSAGQVLQASGVAGTAVTLAWGADATVAARDADPAPTSIAAPNENDRQIAALTELVRELQEEVRALREGMGVSVEGQMNGPAAELQGAK